MKLIFFILIIGLSSSQEINPVPKIDLLSTPFNLIKIYQNQIFLVDSLTPSPYLLQYDLDTNTFTQNVTISSIPSRLFIYNQTLIIGDLLGTFFLTSISNINTSITIYNEPQGIDAFEIDPIGNFLFVGGYWGVSKYDLMTMTRITSEFILLNWVNVLAVYQQSLYIGGYLHSQPDPFGIQVRNCSNLNQLFISLSNHTDQIIGLIQHEGLLYSASADVTIKQWNLTTNQLVNTFFQENSYFTPFAQYGKYLFCIGPTEWIQRELPSGKIIRRVNAYYVLRSVVVYPPYLIIVSYYGLFKYLIPELPGFTPISTTISTVATSSFLKTTQSQLASQESLYFTANLDSRKLTTETPTAIKQQNQNLSFLLYYIIGAAFVLLIIIALTVFLVFKYLAKRNLKKINETNTMTTSTSTATDSTTINSTLITSTTTSSIVSDTKTTDMTSSYFTNTTLIGTKNVYSIPGYLQLTTENILITKEIARGGQGTISIAEILNSQFVEQYKVKQVIVKSTCMNFEQMTDRQKNIFNQELAIIQYFKERSGFVKLYGYTLEPACLILKLYPLGSMENLILKRGHFKTFIISKLFIINFLSSLASSIKELHYAGFVHCDIKPQNILLETDQKNQLLPILSDFGISQTVSEQVLTVKAMTVENLKGFSLYYAAPEQIKQMREKNFKPMQPDLIKKRDVYALGGILFGLFTGTEPWQK